MPPWLQHRKNRNGKKFACNQRGRIGRTRIRMLSVLHGSFRPQRPPSSWKYSKYSCVLWRNCEQKSHMQNCKAPQNEIFLLKTKHKSHGKADAYHGIFLQYWGERAVLRRQHPYPGPPFVSSFLRRKLPLGEWKKLCYNSENIRGMQDGTRCETKK